MLPVLAVTLLEGPGAPVLPKSGNDPVVPAVVEFPEPIVFDMSNRGRLCSECSSNPSLIFKYDQMNWEGW